MRTSLGPILLFALSGCGLLDPVACTQEARPGISLVVMDSVTGGPVTAADVMVIASDGAVADTVRGPHIPAPPLAAGLAYERAGTYRVEARATGYTTWARSGVRVTEDECHVRTVQLAARMRPL
jgi:hypothetical protein